jgi:hypothetical protein
MLAMRRSPRNERTTRHTGFLRSAMALLIASEKRAASPSSANNNPTPHNETASRLKRGIPFPFGAIN